MKLEMRGELRLEQRLKLAPHMIQSMEILQLPILALQERIEQELNSNPVLEVDESSSSDQADAAQQAQETQAEKELDAAAESETVEDFGRIHTLDDDYRDHMNQGGSFRRTASSQDVDKKLEAIKNTAAPQQSLHEYLNEQWRLIDAEEPVKKAGSLIIDYINDRGYLTVRLEQLHNKDRVDFTFEDLQTALTLVQTLEPSGIGAQNLRECLLIQLAQLDREDSFEARLISKHMNQLLENQLPAIARKLDCTIEQVNQAIEKLSKLDTSPGLQIGRYQNHPITADIIVESSDDNGSFSVRLADTNLPNLRLSSYYEKISKDTRSDERTRQFLQNNIRSAQWIIDAIEQRKSTLLKVARTVVKYQIQFFAKGQVHLKPLPMAKVADEVGVHVATVSRAVAGKYVQCIWGILPLRKFFSGGREDANGNTHSWEAIRVKLQQIIDSEDKSKPLSDESIRKELADYGIDNLARRTVAKYRKILNVPAARFRKKY